MQKPELFMTLPDYVATPDGMAIDANGDLILACPNYADPALPGCLVRINDRKEVEKWIDVPHHSETGCARPMGIAFGPDGDLYICDNQGWSGAQDLVFKGRVLRLSIKGHEVVKTTIVAQNMEHPNGIKIFGEYLYVTQSMLSRVKDPSGKLVSCVYRFHLDDHDIDIRNTMEDPNLFAPFITENPDMQYGVDGIEIDQSGNLFIGNFGDGTVFKFFLDAKGNVSERKIWAHDPENLKSTDGMVFDNFGNLFIADFVANAIIKVDPSGRVEKYAQSSDCNGFDGGLDQPGEPCIWNGKLIASCFDLVTGSHVVNQAHEMPATLSVLELNI